MTVYIVQEMRGRDLSDAVTFGDIEVLVPVSEQASYSTQPLIKQLTRKLSKFTDDDYLLLSGDPVIIALAASRCNPTDTSKSTQNNFSTNRQI